MANTKSATKRARQSVTRKERNQQRKKSVRTLEKQLRAKLADGNKEEAQTMLKSYTSLIGKAAQKGIIHKNTAARKVGRLSSICQA